MVEETGGRAPDGVQDETDSLEDEQAREVEQWLTELVRARKRIERGGHPSSGRDQHTHRPTSGGASAEPPG